jgi:hypothetical protein
MTWLRENAYVEPKAASALRPSLDTRRRAISTSRSPFFKQRPVGHGLAPDSPPRAKSFSR